MRIDDPGAGDAIGRVMAKQAGIDYDDGFTWTSTTSPAGVMNGIYFTNRFGGSVLIYKTQAEYYDDVREAGIEFP